MTGTEILSSALHVAYGDLVDELEYMACMGDGNGSDGAYKDARSPGECICSRRAMASAISRQCARTLGLTGVPAVG
jgi:hypothetical protein